MVLSAVPLQRAQAASSYTEKLNVYVAGSDALWYFTFGGVNASSQLSTLESVPGLSWYNVTAIKTTGWPSDFQVFGANGYNLLPVPFVPSQGLFLTVGSDSYSHAQAAASALDPYFLTSFVSLSNGTGTYAFYSPISFGDLVPHTLLAFLPSTEGGFASAVVSSSLASLASPFAVLEGVKSSSGFTHSLVVGSITSNALSSSQPSIMSYFGSSVGYLRASNHSSSSVVQVTFLDGQVASSDAGATVQNSPQFRGYYTLTLAPGKRFSSINATVSERPAPLLASRTVDVGVLHTGGNLTVALTFRDLSGTATISRLAFTDSWWNSTGGFKLVSGSGSDSVSLSSLAPGGVQTPVYKLQYTGTTVGSITIPASVLRYQYTVGSKTFNATALLNPIRLSLGAEDAVVVATIAPNGNLGKPVGQSQGFNVTVTNVGTLPASSVTVAGRSIPGGGLAAKTSQTVAVSQSALGLLGVNATRSYSVTYQDPAGASLNATTNLISDVFSHSSMKLGYPALVASARISSLANQQTNLTLTFSTSNSGSVNVTSFKATDNLPAGLGCGTISGTGLTCAGGALTIDYPVLNSSATLNAYMKYNLTGLQSYILAPFTLQGSTAGMSVSGSSNAVPIPAGMAVSKQYTPSQAFGGMKSQASLTATNAGPLTVYNATLKSTADTFDTVSSSAALSKGPVTVAAGGNVTVTYPLTIDQVSGAETGYAATVSFYFGATPFAISSSAPTLEVYQTLAAKITTSPATPEEGKSFTINLVITNPSAVEVSNVTFTLPVPSGLSLSQLANAQVSSGVLTIAAGTIGAHKSFNASAAAVASSGITVPFQNAKLTFSYAGVTLHGSVPSSTGIGIAEDVFTRYIIPTGFILIAVFAIAFYVRRKAATAGASPK